MPFDLGMFSNNVKGMGADKKSVFSALDNASGGEMSSSGMSSKDLNDENLKPVISASQGVEPDKNEGDLDKQKLIARALVALVPTLVGAAVGGNKGGAIGAEAGIKGLESMKTEEDKQQAKKDKKQDATDKLKTEIAMTKFKDSLEGNRQKELQSGKIAADVSAAEKKFAQEKELAGMKTKGEKDLGVIADKYVVTPGAKPSEDDAKKFKGTVESSEMIKSSINNLKSLIKENGSEWSPTQARDQMKRVVREIQVKLKEVEGLGVLSDKDMALLQEQVPDPTEWTMANMLGGGRVDKNLDAFAKSLQEKVDAAAKVRGFQEMNQEPQLQGSNLQMLLEEKQRRMQQGAAKP